LKNEGGSHQLGFGGLTRSTSMGHTKASEREGDPSKKKKRGGRKEREERSKHERRRAGGGRVEGDCSTPAKRTGLPHILT